MKRREFISLAGGVAVWPIAVTAQKAVPIIAILGSGAADASSSKLQMSLLEASMREIGLIQGNDFVFVTKWADGYTDRFPALAAELLADRPRAVVVSTPLAAIAVQNLTRTIPIVGTGMNAPVATGLVASLARPGGNITGVSTMAEDVLLKLFEMIREALPRLRRITVITNPTNTSNQIMLDLLKSIAAKDGISIDAARVSIPDDLDVAFAEMSRQAPDALIVLTDNSLFALANSIIARALALRVPTFGNYSETFSRAGAVFAYSRDPKESFQGVARLLKKLLNGAAVADLPFEQPTKFLLVINLKTAKVLGISVPPTLIALADRVIE